jgi:hypothetical protein
MAKRLLDFWGMLISLGCLSAIVGGTLMTLANYDDSGKLIDTQYDFRHFRERRTVLWRTILEYLGRPFCSIFTITN